MFERIKYAFTDFCICFWFAIAFYITTGNVFLLGILVSILIAITDVLLLDGEKYGAKSFLYLAFNKIISTLFIVIICSVTNNALFWLSFIMYVFETIRVTLCQIEMISDDILYENIVDSYQYTLYELEKLLTKNQKHSFSKLKEFVETEQIYVFLSAYDAKEIQKLLETDLKLLAIMIQKEDYSTINELLKL